MGGPGSGRRAGGRKLAPGQKMREVKGSRKLVANTKNVQKLAKAGNAIGYRGSVAGPKKAKAAGRKIAYLKKSGQTKL
jgi:hypothetical protein